MKICGNYKHWNCNEDYCTGSGNHEIYEEDTCEYWEKESELSDDELEAIR